MRIALLLLVLSACAMDMGVGAAEPARPSPPSAPDQRRFTIPDVHGLTPAEARDRLQDAGHRGRVKEYDGKYDTNCDLPAGRVCVTSPPAGKEISATAAVSLMLAVP